MHHSKPTTSSCGRCTHSQHNPCPTELTPCGEGSMTPERRAWCGDMNEKRRDAWQINNGGISMHHSHATTSSHNRCMRASLKPGPVWTHKLQGRKHDKGKT